MCKEGQHKGPKVRKTWRVQNQQKVSVAGASGRQRKQVKMISRVINLGFILSVLRNVKEKICTECVLKITRQILFALLQ